MVEDQLKFDISVSGVLEKYEGEPLPENLFERITIENGEVVKIEKFDIAGKEVD